MLPDKEALKQQLYLRQVRILSSRTEIASVIGACFLSFCTSAADQIY